ncbi:hypothetical protein CUMW_049190 [Citrus unshiu]|nr:hypothetical protein CUMW_049190 [Citrus unshiu]
MRCIGAHSHLWLDAFGLLLVLESLILSPAFIPLFPISGASISWILEVFFISNSMKHVVKILTLLVAITALWFGLLQTSVIPRSHKGCHLTLLLLFCQLPIYFIVSLGCYGLLMVGIGLMYFPTCPQEALLLQQDIKEAKEYLERKGIDVSE